MAGGERQQQLAYKLAEKWREYGFDKVELPKYKVLLSYPEDNNPNTISVVSEDGVLVKTFKEQLKVRFLSFQNLLLQVSLCHLKKGILSNVRQHDISFSVK